MWHSVRLPVFTGRAARIIFTLSGDVPMPVQHKVVVRPRVSRPQTTALYHICYPRVCAQPRKGSQPRSTTKCADRQPDPLLFRRWVSAKPAERCGNLRGNSCTACTGFRITRSDRFAELRHRCRQPRFPREASRAAFVPCDGT